MHEPPLVIEPLGPHHDRAAFTCGEPALDRYLQRRASQDVRRKISQVFVALGEPATEVAGYYTLSAASFGKAELPAARARRLPHYPVPAALLGRLAVASSHQGRGLGESLLLDAVRRVVRASATIAVHALVVDAKNDHTVAFYERYGFKRCPSLPRRLFLPIQTFEQLAL
ncbi:MAG: GNAT family N-acetyltransferase [Gammaproteobacteria bacterium]|nr:GNAT family N-acetyltransferase [Gammaproteobacteria bacterium]